MNQEQLRRALMLLGDTPLVLTEATSMTVSQCIANSHGLVNINDGSGVAITLPAAGAALGGVVLNIANIGAGASTVVVTAGFGGAGSGSDTVTLAQGDGCIARCDGSVWSVVHHTTPA